MVNKLIEKVGAKFFGLLCSLVTAMAAALIAKIREYFLKQKYFEKGRKAAEEYWNEQQKKWEDKVNEIKEDSNKTIREKVEELRKIKRAFEEYVKRNK